MDNLFELKKIFDKNAIENRIEEVSTIDEGTTSSIVFQFPIARESEEIRIFEDDHNIQSIINCNFLKYRGLSNYEAIWSSELNIIECEVNFPRYGMAPNRFLLRKLFSLLDPKVCTQIGNEHDAEYPALTLFSDEQIKVSIGYSSIEFAFLSTYKERHYFYDLQKDRCRFKLTLKIENINPKTEEEAQKILEKVSNSLFYQIDILFETTISLSPRRVNNVQQLRRREKTDLINLGQKELILDYEYDDIPMSLYWFAKSSISSSIFQYFALYQVLEYYYPIYTTNDLKEKIQNIVKDPRFNINNNSDVLRLLNIIKSNSRNDIGDEREQLNITLQKITSGDEIINFINDNEYLLEYFSSKNAKNLSDNKLRLSDKIGIVSDVAKRIYDIRCRIVHNKASETDKKILPMTKDVNYLDNEVALLEFLARKAIISNSHPMYLNDY